MRESIDFNFSVSKEQYDTYCTFCKEHQQPLDKKGISYLLSNLIVPVSVIQNRVNHQLEMYCDYTFETSFSKQPLTISCRTPAPQNLNSRTYYFLQFHRYYQARQVLTFLFNPKEEKVNSEVPDNHSVNSDIVVKAFSFITNFSENIERLEQKFLKFTQSRKECKEILTKMTSHGCLGQKIADPVSLIIATHLSRDFLKQQEKGLMAITSNPDYDLSELQNILVLLLLRKPVVCNAHIKTTLLKKLSEFISHNKLKSPHECTSSVNRTLPSNPKDRLALDTTTKIPYLKFVFNPHEISFLLYLLHDNQTAKNTFAHYLTELFFSCLFFSVNYLSNAKTYELVFEFPPQYSRKNIISVTINNEAKFHYMFPLDMKKTPEMILKELVEFIGTSYTTILAKNYKKFLDNRDTYINDLYSDNICMSQYNILGQRFAGNVSKLLIEPTSFFFRKKENPLEKTFLALLSKLMIPIKKDITDGRSPDSFRHQNAYSAILVLEFLWNSHFKHPHPVFRLVAEQYRHPSLSFREYLSNTNSMSKEDSTINEGPSIEEEVTIIAFHDAMISLARSTDSITLSDIWGLWDESKKKFYFPHLMKWALALMALLYRHNDYTLLLNDLKKTLTVNKEKAAFTQNLLTHLDNIDPLNVDIYPVLSLIDPLQKQLLVHSASDRYKVVLDQEMPILLQQAKHENQEQRFAALCLETRVMQDLFTQLANPNKLAIQPDLPIENRYSKWLTNYYDELAARLLALKVALPKCRDGVCSHPLRDFYDKCLSLLGMDSMESLYKKACHNDVYFIKTAIYWTITFETFVTRASVNQQPGARELEPLLSEQKPILSQQDRVKNYYEKLNQKVSQKVKGGLTITFDEIAQSFLPSELNTCIEEDLKNMSPELDPGSHLYLQ